jgi:methylamine--corrinoid protein Co-methyltransferase
MITYELAAHSLAATVSGWHLNPAAVARNRHPSHCSGMEPRIHAEVGHVAARCGITRKDASRITAALLDLYEKDVKNAPIGKSFRECYDVSTVKPTDEYVHLWERSKRKLENLGLNFKRLYD